MAGPDLKSTFGLKTTEGRLTELFIRCEANKETPGDWTTSNNKSSDEYIADTLRNSKLKATQATELNSKQLNRSK